MCEKPDKLIVISGPTASGKSALGVEVCLRLGGEVISADSMQIYRGMDIGTAKITAEEMRGVPHHMLDVAEPEEDFSVSRYVEMADRCVQDVLARGKVPVVVGGTGLYIDSLLASRSFAAAPEDRALRAELSEHYDAVGGEAFRAELAAVDPERAARLAPADKKRLVRAMEVYRLSGETITAHDERTKALPPRYDSLRFALDWADRAALYARIDRRVEEMVAGGLFEEVRDLLNERRLPPTCTAMQAIGYKEAAAYWQGAVSREEAAAEIALASRRYAKRQLTWLRRDKGLHWIVWDGAPDLSAAAETVCRAWEAFCADG